MLRLRRELPEYEISVNETKKRQSDKNCGQGGGIVACAGGKDIEAGQGAEEFLPIREDLVHGKLQLYRSGAVPRGIRDAAS